MPDSHPLLGRLLADDDPRDEAWTAFVREYTRLLLHVARESSQNRDEAMDAYANILEKLREDGCRRLRAYSAHPRSQFATWLVVVARRVCIDYHRQKYGRACQGSNPAKERREIRHKLENLADGVSIDDGVLDGNEIDIGLEFEKAEERSELEAVTSSLTPADRLLLTLRFEDELSAAEIADILGMPSQFHVYRRLKVILAGLKKQIGDR
ncbi:MAG TPA: sigma-70 family RNA polymerase sigma factor [Gemmatimonadaceae bacterium]|nr:sigma-70 family RNA polymerase sigma factor [Gemmatimonadaceae bacterium]